MELKTATFAAGCFWGVEEKFRKTPGVIATEVGYSGGHTKNPTYEEVCSDQTGHAEAVKIKFDPKVISYKDLLKKFFEIHDPTQINAQGPDIGSQYRSIIFYHTPEQKSVAEQYIEELELADKGPISTELLPQMPFCRAEEYHQKYISKKNNH